MRLLDFVVVLASLPLLAACSEGRSALLVACETAIQERLLAPSTFRVVSVRETSRVLSADEYLTKAGIIAWGRDAIEAGIASNDPPQLLEARIEYDAQNAFGVPLRSVDVCAYVADNTFMVGRASSALVEINGQRYTDWLVAQSQGR